MIVWTKEEENIDWRVLPPSPQYWINEMYLQTCRTDQQLFPGLTDPVLGRGQRHPAPAVPVLHLHLAQLRSLCGAGTEPLATHHGLTWHQPPAEWKTLFISSVYCNLRVIWRKETNFQNSSPNIGNVAKLQRPVWQNWRPADRDIIIWDLLGGISSVMNCPCEVCLREPASVPADRVPDSAVGSTGLLLTGPSISYPRRDTQTPSHWAGYALNLSAWRWKINYKFALHFLPSREYWELPEMISNSRQPPASLGEDHLQWGM